MKALVKSRSEPGIWLQDVNIPKPGTNEVLIRIEKTGICGTDLHIYNWDAWAQRNIKTPRIIGHEFVGRIVDIGPGVKGYELGARVSAEGHINCGLCRNCRAGKRHLCHKAVGIGGGRDGAFAEYLVMPAGNLWPIHDDISSDIAAILDPFGNAVHCALSFDVVGEDVLITGAGPIGIMAAAACRFIGARHIVITDVNDERLQLAENMGASKAVNVSGNSIEAAMEELKMSNGFDVGLEMSGNPRAFNSMIQNMYHGGHVALLGFLPPETEISWDQIIFKGLHIKGVYGREMYETWYKMTQLLRSGLDITPIITHRFAVDDYEEAFRVVHDGHCGKVILEWE
ncbi:L-threonine 3-dehydrogenase [Candidatus Tenderia electrophaga]|jgi:threonine 3-dehydrogenase|uniref:L-threonine 3-dehydrogenase n=1 Tax=Candidatus Tenderia electrophaga TaxID=1748243 RepID=A0A0S2T981_9GAMM|nr:L-threonine 3-dehydrogenase [Candidatus Tenderia electrophaga]